MSERNLQPDWKNTSMLALFHLLGVGGIVYLATVKCSPWTIGLAIFWFICAGMAVTAGYHRLFAHRAYQAHPIVKGLLLLFGTASVQNSALRWCADHRRHHAQTDRDADPYGAPRGFWWSHIGWIMFKPEYKNDPEQSRDLHNDPLVVLQHRYYLLLAWTMGALVPCCLGMLWGDPWGGLLVAGFLRLVVQWHATFSINSLAHMIGSQPYSTRNSARDSFFTSVLTMGEGYHNFHHAFQHDYRNGVRWYHLDPTKWMVWSLQHVGLTSDLRRVPATTIQARREKVAEERRLAHHGEKSMALPAAAAATAIAMANSGADATRSETAPSPVAATSTAVSADETTTAEQDKRRANRGDAEVEVSQLS